MTAIDIQSEDPRFDLDPHTGFRRLVEELKMKSEFQISIRYKIRYLI